MTPASTAPADMVQIVARALCAAEGLDWDSQSSFLTTASGGENEQEHYLEQARAAISAYEAALAQSAPPAEPHALSAAKAAKSGRIS